MTNEDHSLMQLRKTIWIFLLSTLLWSLSSCEPKMPPPPAGDDFKTEIQYTEAYLDLNKKMFRMLSSELDLRRDPAKGKDSSVSEAIHSSFHSPDGKYILSVNDKKQLIVHQKGMDSSRDQVIYEEASENFNLSLMLSASNRYIFIVSSDGNTSETRFLPADLSSLKPYLIQPREKGIQYRVEHFGSDILWILTNKNAPGRKLMQALVSNPRENYWLQVIPECDSILLEDFIVLDDQFILLFESYKPGVGIRVYDRKKNDEAVIRFNEPKGYLKFIYYDPGKEIIHLSFSSLLSPITHYEFAIKTGRLGKQKKEEVKNYLKNDYRFQTLWTTSTDGSKIPISLIYKKDLGKIDGSNPLLLILDTDEPSHDPLPFNPAYLSLLDRGFYIAIAFPGKDHATDDYLRCARFLIDQKFSAVGRITGSGEGKAALLLEEIVKLKPGLFTAVTLDYHNTETRYIPEHIPFKAQEFPAMMISSSMPNEDAPSDLLRLARNIRAANSGKNILLISRGESMVPLNRTAIFCTFILQHYKIKK